MQYRREIDGLRTIAVVPVVLFHAGFEVFSGGFVGVDVFFVISGYLITSILIRELEDGNFSIIRFYERRCRRILPALFFVMAVSAVLSWFWMLPSQLVQFGKSVAAVVLFASNILFWREGGYFGEASDLKPLLHTWSLAVEEQYYVLFPIFLLMFWRFGRNRLAITTFVCALASLALCEILLRSSAISSGAIFYLAPTRAWELLAGSLCACAFSARAIRPNAMLAWAGLALVAYAMLAFDSTTPFPSLYTLAPVLGAVAIILWGDGSKGVGRVLASRPMVGIGLVSYSAYLWHQPLFAFARLHLGEPPQWLMLLLSGVTLGLASLTWRFIEQPFRGRKAPLLACRTGLFATFGALGAVFLGLGLLMVVYDGFPGRSSSTTIKATDLTERLRVNRGLSSLCNNVISADACRTTVPTEFLLWGDSYAMHLVEGFLSSEADVALRQLTYASCNPILGIARIDASNSQAQSADCIRFNNAVMEAVEQDTTSKYVVLSSPFAILANKVNLGSGQILPAGDNETLITEALLKTVARIRATGKKVVIFSPTPANGTDVALCVARAIFFNGDLDACNFTKEDGIAHMDKTFAMLDRIANEVPVIRLDDMICPNGICDMFLDDVILYRDSGHLSVEGVQYLGKKFGFASLVRATAK